MLLRHGHTCKDQVRYIEKKGNIPFALLMHHLALRFHGNRELQDAYYAEDSRWFLNILAANSEKTTWVVLMVPGKNEPVTPHTISAVQGHSGGVTPEYSRRVEVDPRHIPSVCHGTAKRYEDKALTEGIIAGRDEAFFCATDPACDYDEDRVRKKSPGMQHHPPHDLKRAYARPYLHLTHERRRICAVSDVCAALSMGIRFYQTSSYAIVCSDTIPNE